MYSKEIRQIIMWLIATVIPLFISVITGLYMILVKITDNEVRSKLLEQKFNNHINIEHKFYNRLSRRNKGTHEKGNF